jgi:hypothetical protein
VVSVRSSLDVLGAPLLDDAGGSRDEQLALLRNWIRDACA